MTEADLLGEVILACEQHGLYWHHCQDSRHCQGEAGLPDLLIIGRGILWRELKSEDGRSSRAQLHYLNRLRNTGADVGVWRPEDLDSGRIARELEEIT